LDDLLNFNRVSYTVHEEFSKEVGNTLELGEVLDSFFKGSTCHSITDFNEWLD
jgi:hypothetical protein